MYRFQPANLLKVNTATLTLRKECPYSEFYLACIFRIRTEYRYLLSKSLHSVQMRENADEKNSEYGHFLCSVIFLRIFQNSRNISFWEYFLTAAFEKIT